MQGPAPIPVFRPSKLTDGPEFQGSLVESPANIFYQQVKASRATLNRMQFQWRSVSDNLLVSPVARIRFQLKISSPVLWSQVSAALSLQGRIGMSGAGGATAAGQVLGVQGGNYTIAASPAPCLVYADGDALTNCCSSINFQFNGTSLSLNRTNRFWRDYQRTQLSSEDSARIYKAAGGAYDQFDKVPVASISTANHANRGAALTALSCGYTQDSGIAERSKALYGNCVDFTVADETTRTVWVSYPIPAPDEPMARLRPARQLSTKTARLPSPFRGRPGPVDGRLRQNVHSPSRRFVRCWARNSSSWAEQRWCVRSQWGTRPSASWS